MERIDEIFKNTFDKQTIVPSESGWDVPSPTVWNAIETELQSKSVGKSTRNWWAMASVLCISAVGVWFLLMPNKADTVPPVAQPAIKEQPAIHTPAETSSPSTEQISPAVKPEIGSSRNQAKTAQPNIGAKIPVNSTERNKLQQPKVIAPVPQEYNAPNLPTPKATEPILEDKIEQKLPEIIEPKVQKTQKSAPKREFPNTLEKRKAEEKTKESGGNF